MTLHETLRTLENKLAKLPENLRYYVAKDGEVVIYNKEALDRGIRELGIIRDLWDLVEAINDVEMHTGEVVIVDTIKFPSPVERWDD